MKGLTKAFVDLARSVTYIAVPEWATARLMYFLQEMGDVHSMSIFPTASFLRDLEHALKSSKLAFADVCVSPHFLVYDLEVMLVPNSCACGPMAPWFLGCQQGGMAFMSVHTVWNEAYIMLVSCIDYALDMTCIQSVSQCFIVCGIL